MLTPCPGNASPVKSCSTPAMILSSVDLPAPLAPRTPIFAPGRNESQMSLRTTVSGGCVFPSPFMVKTYCGAINLAVYHRGLRTTHRHRGGSNVGTATNEATETQRHGENQMVVLLCASRLRGLSVYCPVSGLSVTTV